MSALNFPNDPASVGNVYVGDNGVTYDYVNGKWRGRTASGGGNANTGNWAWSTNSVSTPVNVDLQIQTRSTSTQHNYSFWVSEYGGLGATAMNDLAFGAGSIYDSQGNLYVLGAAGNTNSVTDSLLLKYDPLGNLLWHKTWHDPSGSNCGATNVALAIDSADRIYWIANDWNAGGCWFGYMDTDGNLGLGGTAQEILGFNRLFPTDLACDNEHAYISGIWDSIYPIVIKINGNTGNVVWSRTVTPLDSTETTSSGIYRAITVDPTQGDIWALGDYQDTGGSSWSMMTKLNSSGVIYQTTKLVTSINDIGDAVVYNNGYIYTVVNDSAESKTVVSKFNPTTWDLIWAANLASGIVTPGGDSHNGGFDLSFDAAGNVYVTGTLPYPASNANIWLTKLDPATGIMLYSRVLATSGGSAIFDGISAPLAGHRVADIYENRIAVMAMTQSDLIQGGNFAPRIIVSQLPIDGSIVGTYSNIVIYDATNDLSSYCSTGTYSLTPLSWPSDTQGSMWSLSQLSPSNVTDINTFTNKTITLAAGPVIGIITTTNTWQFTTGGDIVLPSGGAIVAQDNGPVTIKAGNETAYWWSEYGDLLIDNQDEWGSSVEYDSHGNVYIVGGTYHNLNDNTNAIQALLIKYSPTGELLWQKAMFDVADIYIRGEGLWIDSADNLFMIVTNDDNNWGYLLRLDTDGNVVWQVKIDPTPDDNVQLIDIDGDNQGHVYIVGRQHAVSTNNNRRNAWVACYNTIDGTYIWQKNIDITNAADWDTNGYGIAVSTIAPSTVYVTGQAYFNNNSWNPILVSMTAADGLINWANTLTRNDGWYSQSNDVAVDARGMIYTVGSNSDGVEISKWNIYGTLIWSKVIDKFGSNSWASSLDFDRDGYLYITGSTNNAGGTSNVGWIVIKMDEQGNIIWQNILGSKINDTYQWYYDGHKEIAVNSNRNSLVITGNTYVGTTATAHTSLWDSNILTAQFPLDGTMTGVHGPFQYTPSTLSITNSNVTPTIVTATIISSTYTMSTATVATISNDEAADTHHLTGDTWKFTTDGHIMLPPNGDIIDSASGQSVLGQISNAPYVARLDNKGILVDAAGRSLTGEGSYITTGTSAGWNFEIKNLSGGGSYAQINSESTINWISIESIAAALGVSTTRISGANIDYQIYTSQQRNDGQSGSGRMIGNIMWTWAYSPNWGFSDQAVTHTEVAVSSNTDTASKDVVKGLVVWQKGTGTSFPGYSLQLARSDGLFDTNSGNYNFVNIQWTAKVFLDGFENYC